MEAGTEQAKIRMLKRVKKALTPDNVSGICFDRDMEECGENPDGSALLRPVPRDGIVITIRMTTI